MATLSQNQSSVRYYMGWYGNCSQDTNSLTGGCVPFDLSSDPKIKVVWEVSDGIKAFTSESPTFSPIQELEAGRCYMIALNPGDGTVEIPHMVLSGEGGYVGQSCAIGQYFVTVEAHTMPYTTPVVDSSYGYFPVQYSPGDTVTLTANTKEGRRFEGWTSFSPASIWAEVTDPSSPTISFTMPSEPVTAKLDYMDLTRDTDGDGIPDHLDPYPNQSPQAINWADTDLTLLVVGDTAELKATAQTDITYTISDTSVATISGSQTYDLEGVTQTTGGEYGFVGTDSQNTHNNEEGTPDLSMNVGDTMRFSRVPDALYDFWIRDPAEPDIKLGESYPQNFYSYTFTPTAAKMYEYVFVSKYDYNNYGTVNIVYSGNLNVSVSQATPTITIVGDGTAEVTATAPANSQYFGATATISFQTDADSDGDGIPDSQDTEPYQQSQAIVWNDDLSDLNVGDTFTLTASAQTAVTYATSDTSIATISGNTLSLVAEGSVTITATAESSSDYFTATSVVNAFITAVDIITIDYSQDLLDAGLYPNHTLGGAVAAGDSIVNGVAPPGGKKITNFTVTRLDTNQVLPVEKLWSTGAGGAWQFTWTVPADMTSGTISVNALIEDLSTSSVYVTVPDFQGTYTIETQDGSGTRSDATLAPGPTYELADGDLVVLTLTAPEGYELTGVTALSGDNSTYPNGPYPAIGPGEYYLKINRSYTSSINIYPVVQEQESPLDLSINSEGKLEVSFDYPEFTSYDPDTRCYKILLTFFDDTYNLRRMAWRPDAIGVHPENQRITFVIEDRPEFLGDADQVNGKVNQEPHNSHLDSFRVYHTANHATGSDIYGNASFYYNWSDYIRSTRVRAELKVDNYETFHSSSWFDYSSGTGPPSAEIDLPDTNGNGIWDSLDWDDEFQYSLSGDIITGSFRYSDKIFLNHGAGPSNYPDSYPSISLRWTDDYNGSSDASQPAWDGSLASSYSEGELVNFTFNANSIYGGTLDHLNYRYPIHTDSDKSKPIQFSLDFMYPSSYSSNMVRSSGPRVADYNWDADGDSHFDALDVYTAERVGSNIRVTFPYREGVFGVTINQDYAVELTFKDENGSWVAWGVDWWTQGSNNYSDGEIITIEQPLPAGYEQYINNELTVEWAAGTGGGTTYGQHMMVRKTLPAVVDLTGYTKVVDSPAQVVLPTDGSEPTTDVNGDPVFKYYGDYYGASNSVGVDLASYLGLHSTAVFRNWMPSKFAKIVIWGPVYIVYTSEGVVRNNRLELAGEVIPDSLVGGFTLENTMGGSYSSTYFDLIKSGDGTSYPKIDNIHAIYGDFAIYTED